MNDTDLPVQNELDALKSRAQVLGVKFHPSISLEKLREKVNAAVESEAKAVEDEDPGAEFTEGDAPARTVPAPKKPSEAARRKEMIDDAMRLVRIRLTCMNPAKAEWSGEIFTVSNAVVGTVRKFVPFNAEEGWHVPNILYKMLRDRQCQIFVNGKTKNGVTFRQGKLIREFAIEVLPPLSETELKDLAQRQALAKQGE